METGSSSLGISKRVEYLFERAMQDDWNAVVENYTSENVRLKITQSGETVMHLAVKLGKTEHVRAMVGLLGGELDEGEEAYEILSLKDNRGNTPLHIAAALGNVAICCCLAIKDRRLLALRNQIEATPLFVSVANGKADAFFHLDSLLRQSRQAIDYSIYTRQNGYTILHSAVFGENMGLAALIAVNYPALVNFVDDKSLSPLHILATKGAAFRSGSFIGLIDCILLRWINVGQLVTKDTERPVLNSQLLTSQESNLTVDVDIDNNNNIPPQNNCFNQGNGKMVKICFQTVVSILFKTIPAFIWYIVLNFVTTFLKIAGIGWPHIGLRIKNLRQRKRRWRLAWILLTHLVYNSSMYMNNDIHDSPKIQTSPLDPDQTKESKKDSATKKPETPILIAVKNGIREVVDVILKKYLVAAFDLDPEHKNVAMLAAEKKRVGLYRFLLDKHPQAMERMMVQLDKQGNSVLHHSAMFREFHLTYTPDPASLLRSRYSWYEFVKKKMPVDFLHLHNSNGLTPQEVFMKSHKELIKSGSEWLVKCSETCSLVAALLATVAFATSAVKNTSKSPDDYDSDNDHIFGGVSLFDLYSFFALLGLCSSLVSLLYFIAIRTSSFRVRDFAESLPKKLFMGLMFLLLSMVSIFTSFCFIHHSKLNNDTMRHAAIPIYILGGARLLTLAASQLPFYHGAFFRLTFREPI